ncbi:MAG: AhpC/TSA family protein [Chitinophagaceae bacterium]|nr:AhpC/TSA family protein [Chitinophagaceae bacterium]
MKKKIVFVTLAVGFCFNLVAQVLKPFTLKCILPAAASGKMFLYYQSNEKRKADSCVIVDGKAQFAGSIEGPTIAWLIFDKKEKQLFLEPSAMTLDARSNNVSQARVTGSITQNELEVYNTSIRKIEDRWKVVLDTLSQVNKRSNMAFQELKNWVLVPYFAEMEEANLTFFTNYPTSYVTAYSLQIVARDLSTDSINFFYNRLPAIVKQSVYGRNINDQIERRKLGAVGTVASTFTKTDIDGKTLNLSDLKGKYVLLDFWGSWCLPCRKGNPHLIELYNRYKSRGFEVVGVAADDRTPDAWRKAVKEDQLPWLQVLQGDKPDANVGKNYNVESYPTKILIDREGKIIGRYGEDEAELDKMLAEIFK